MMARKKTVDHGNRHVKFLLRKAMMHLVEPETALDLFAGSGEVAAGLYAGFRDIHCVERNKRKFLRLERNLSSVPGPRAHLYHMDNMEFIRTRLRDVSGISLVDFDAYGSPNRQVKMFLENHRIDRPTLIFATDGGRIACIRGDLWSPGLYSARSVSCSYGRGCSPPLVRGYETLIRQFWLEAAGAYGFRIEIFRIYWKKGKQVAYYGLLVAPG